MMPKILTLEQVANYQRDGYLYPVDVMSAQEAHGYLERLEASEAQPLVFSLSLHGFILGQPFRLRPLRQAMKHCVEHKGADQVWFTRAGEIAKYCYGMKPGIIPGSKALA